MRRLLAAFAVAVLVSGTAAAAFADDNTIHGGPVTLGPTPVASQVVTGVTDARAGPAMDGPYFPDHAPFWVLHEQNLGR